MSLTIKTDRVAQVLRSLHVLTSREVLVGIPTTRAERKEKTEPVNNAEIGYWMEFGAPAANIPARPHLIPGVASVRVPVADRLGRAARAALTGNAAQVDVQLHAAGLIASSAVKALINSGLPPALSERSLAARRRRGRTGEKPLIDTAQYRNAITYVLRRK